MIRVAGKGVGHAGLARDGVDDSERKAFAFEHRPLFDVELEIAECRGIEDSRGQIGGVEAEVADRVGDTCTVAVGQSQRSRVEFAYECETAEEWLGEAHALFLREADDFEVEGQLVQRNPLGYFLREGHTQDDAEDSIERTGIRNRVQMRADQQTRCVGLCRG